MMEDVGPLSNIRFAGQIVTKVIEERNWDDNFVIEPARVINNLKLLYLGADEKTQRNIGTLVDVNSNSAGLCHLPKPGEILPKEYKQNRKSKSLLGRIWRNVNPGVKIVRKYSSTSRAPNKIILSDNGFTNQVFTWRLTKTKVNDFCLASRNLKVPFSIVRSEFRIALFPHLQMRVIQLPCKIRRESMYIILPNSKKPSDLVTLEKIVFLRGMFEQLIANIPNMPLKPVKLAIPRFNFKAVENMRVVLEKFGLEELFHNSEKTQRDDPRISDYIQTITVKFCFRRKRFARRKSKPKYNILVDDEEEEFIADHPFLFIVQNTDTNSIHFVGRVCNPLEVTK